MTYTIRYGDKTTEDGLKESLLPQYNEEKQDQGVRIGRQGDVNLSEEKQMEDIRAKLLSQSKDAYPPPPSVSSLSPSLQFPWMLCDAYPS